MTDLKELEIWIKSGACTVAEALDLAFKAGEVAEAKKQEGYRKALV